MAPILVDPLIALVVTVAAFAFSMRASSRTRFESPYVMYSVALLGRIAGTAAAFAYPPASGSLLPLLPDGDLGFLLFYPILIGAFRLAARAYGGQKRKKNREARLPVLAVLPLIAVDALHLLWGLSGRHLPFTHGVDFPQIPALPYGVWGGLTGVGVGLFATGVLLARKEAT